VYVFVCILPSPFDQFIKRECPKKSGYLSSAKPGIGISRDDERPDGFVRRIVRGKEKVRAVEAPVRLQKTIPVITGGLFALKDTISPERFSAAFHSGASAYFDALGLTMAGKDVGVVADVIRPRVMHLLKTYLSRRGQLFC
jgi:hypothetical protein